MYKDKKKDGIKAANTSHKDNMDVARPPAQTRLSQQNMSCHDKNMQSLFTFMKIWTIKIIATLIVNAHEHNLLNSFCTNGYVCLY